MIVAICGTFDDTFSSGIRGNGKTCSLTAYLYSDHIKDKKEIYTNYHTDFSHLYDTDQIISLISEGDLTNISIGIDEIQRVLNSLGSKSKIINFVDSAISQIRKFDIDFYYTSQRYLNVNNRLRVQTDVFLLPEKRHLDGSICCLDRCKKDHYIYVYSQVPYRKYPISKIDPKIAGKHYDTYEHIVEEFSLPK